MRKASRQCRQEAKKEEDEEENPWKNNPFSFNISTMWRYLLFFIGFGLFALFSEKIDLAISRYFYYGDGHFYESGFTHFFYRVAEPISFFFAALFGTLYLLSWKAAKLKKWRAASLSMVLTFVLGAGLIINCGLKEHWGRPRPKEVVEFGGKHPFRPFYLPHFSHEKHSQKSFPSGHAAVGFYYLALCSVARRLKIKPLFACGALMSAIFGIGLMITRIAQGGHFFSDTLFSLLIMIASAKVCEWLVFEKWKNYRITQSAKH